MWQKSCVALSPDCCVTVSREGKSAGLYSDAVWLAVGQLGRLIVQAANFSMVARLLGPKLFGLFTFLTAIASVAAPFCGLGQANLLLKNVRSGKMAVADCFGNGLLSVVCTGAMLFCLLLGILHCTRPDISPSVVCCVLFSELILMRLIDLVSFTLAASELMARSALLPFLSSVSRLLLLFLVIRFSGALSLQSWSLAYFAASLSTCGVAAFLVLPLWRSLRFKLDLLLAETTEGVMFSWSSCTQNVYNDLDKVMLNEYSGSIATGVYAAAYRIVDISLTPVRSIVSAAYPRMFAVSRDGLMAPIAFTFGLMPRCLLLGLAIFCALEMAAPLAPVILGSEYGDSVDAIRILACIPVLRCIHLLLADCLVALGKQAARLKVQVSAAVLNFCCNLFFLARFGWVGAAWISVVCDLFLLTCMAVVVARVYATSRKKK